MNATNRPLNALDPGEVDSYIDAAIDQLFVPKVATPAAELAPAQATGGEPGDPRTSPGGTSVPELEALHEVLLSLEWEVSERNIRDFESEVRALGQHFASDRHVNAVVQMALGVGKYLRAVGEGATPLGVHFPTATLQTLEVLLRQPVPSGAERKAAVERLLDSYRRLQSEVRRQPTQPAPTTEPAPAGDAAAPPSREVPAPLRPEARAPAAAEPIEELEPAAAEPVEELEPEAIDELEPAVEEAEPVAEEEPEAAPATAPVPGETTLAAKEPPALEPEPAMALQGAPTPPSLPEETVAVSGPIEGLAGSPLQAARPAAEASGPLSPAGPRADASRGAAVRLVARLGALRTDVREGLERAFRAAAAGTEQLDAELTQFRHLLDEGLASALDLAERMVPALEGRPWSPAEPAEPAPASAHLAAELVQVRQSLEALAAAVREIEGRLAPGAAGDPASPGAPQPQLPTGLAAAPDAPPAPAAPVAEVNAYRVSAGGRPVAFATELLANAFPLTQGQAGRIRERGYATLKDFRRPFRSLKSGLVGPLAALEGKELERLRFPLVPEVAGKAGLPSGAVLLSDGRNHAVLLTDAILERTPGPAPEHELFCLGTAATPHRE